MSNSPTTPGDENRARGLTRDLNRLFDGAPAEKIVKAVVQRALAGRAAVVSSFGTESAVMLHLVAQIEPTVPVIFLDTGKLFPQTLAYRDRLIAFLGLSDVRTVKPDENHLKAHDPAAGLWAGNPNHCCFIRKVRPLRRALEGFDAWFTGRKRHHGEARADLPVFEAQDGRIKINPLAHWTGAQVQAYLDTHDLPRHPLEAAGFPSVGCAPCTGTAAPGGNVRAGRWTGSSKTECGIHLPALTQFTEESRNEKQR